MVRLEDDVMDTVDDDDVRLPVGRLFVRVDEIFVERPVNRFLVSHLTVGLVTALFMPLRTYSTGDSEALVHQLLNMRPLCSTD